MIAIAMANGAIREAWLVPRSISTITLIVLLAWLTLAFEFGLGWWSGASWAQMAADYNLAAGRLWALVPLWVAVGPYIFFRLTPA